jgi:acyl-coenzyme A synthetase/AMP-(fatty) acid ligase
MQFGTAESIEHWGTYRPHSPAVIHDGRVVTYGELNKAANAISAEMVKINSTNERVGIAIKQKFQLLVAIIAALKIGKSAVLLNTELTDDKLRVNLQDAAVSFLVRDDQNVRVEELLPPTQKNQVLNVSLLATSTSQHPLKRALERRPEDEWGVLFSSGTTGPPKGIERSHDSMVTEFLGWCLELGLTRDTCFYISRPIFYTGGLVLAFSTLLLGGRIIINEYIDGNNPNEVWADYQKTLSSHSVSWAFFIPDQIRAFLAILKDMDSSVTGANNILVMGARIYGEEKIEARRRLSSRIVESWGNSESLGTITDPEDLDERPNSIGRPFLTDELYILDENGRPLGPHKMGRIAGNEEAGFHQYCNRPIETSLARQNKLIVSEDIGYIDEKGFFYISARQQECVLIRGETVLLPDVESKIKKHNAVVDCCVVATETGGDLIELVAVLEISSSSKIANRELLQQFNNSLSESEALTDLLIVNELPHVPSGKINRAEVEALVRERT